MSWGTLERRFLGCTQRGTAGAPLLLAPRRLPGKCWREERLSLRGCEMGGLRHPGRASPRLARGSSARPAGRTLPGATGASAALRTWGGPRGGWAALPSWRLHQLPGSARPHGRTPSGSRSGGWHDSRPAPAPPRHLRGGERGAAPRHLRARPRPRRPPPPIRARRPPPPYAVCAGGAVCAARCPPAAPGAREPDVTRQRKWRRRRGIAPRHRDYPRAAAWRRPPPPPAGA